MPAALASGRSGCRGWFGWLKAGSRLLGVGGILWSVCVNCGRVPACAQASGWASNNDSVHSFTLRAHYRWTGLVVDVESHLEEIRYMQVATSGRSAYLPNLRSDSTAAEGTGGTALSWTLEAFDGGG
eukprot:1776508-Pleurochrysis_carterae.AAC.1